MGDKYLQAKQLNRDELKLMYMKLEELIKRQDRGGAIRYMEDNGITPELVKDFKKDFAYGYGHYLDPLYYAASAGDLEMVKILINIGFSLEGCPVSTLIVACMHDKPEIIKFLAEEHDADLENKKEFGPPLKEAIDYNSMDALKCLLDLGASPNQCYDVSIHLDYDEETMASALHHAILTSNLPACQLLIDGGADVNFNPEDYGLTPLHNAVCAVEMEITLLLIDSGADVNATDFEGMTPFLSAVAHLSDTVLDDDLQVRRRKDVLHILDLLRSYGAYHEAKDENGMTALHHAVFHCNIDMVRYLVLNVNVSLKNTELPDDTLFSLAIKKKRWVNHDIFKYGDQCCDVIGFLVAAGYDLREEPSIYDDNLPLLALPKGCSLMTMLRQFASMPHSLTDLCVFQIRESLGCGANVSARLLPLPELLIKMVRLDAISE